MANHPNKLKLLVVLFVLGLALAFLVAWMFVPFMAEQKKRTPFGSTEPLSNSSAHFQTQAKPNS